MDLQRVRHVVGAGGRAVRSRAASVLARLSIWRSPTRRRSWRCGWRRSNLGAWIVPSDPMSSTPELAQHIERTRPVVGFCAAARAAVYRPAAGDMPVVELDEADCELEPFGSDAVETWPAPEPRDRAAVMFTSGTTGRPKGVEITQANYAFAGATMARAANLEARHRQLVVLPLFHVNAQYYSFASAIWAGASVALMHTFSASRFLEQAHRSPGHPRQPVRRADPDDPRPGRPARSPTSNSSTAGTPSTSPTPSTRRSPR